jgi:hypothetical protein
MYTFLPMVRPSGIFFGRKFFRKSKASKALAIPLIQSQASASGLKTLLFKNGKSGSVNSEEAFINRLI